MEGPLVRGAPFAVVVSAEEARPPAARGARPRGTSMAQTSVDMIGSILKMTKGDVEGSKS